MTSFRNPFKLMQRSKLEPKNKNFKYVYQYQPIYVDKNVVNWCPITCILYQPVLKGYFETN